MNRLFHAWARRGAFIDVRTLLWAALALAASSGPAWAQPRDYVYVAYGPYWYGGVYDHAALAVEDPGALDVVSTTPFQSGLWTVNPQPDGSHVYLTSVDSTNIVAIDTSTNRVDPAHMILAGIVPVRLNDQRGGSRGVFFQPDGTLAYVVGEPQPDSWVIKVFSTSPPGQVGFITLPVGVSPQSLNFSPDGSLLFVSEFTNQADNFLMAFRAAPPFNLQGGIQVGRGFMAPPAFNHSGNKILVTSQDPPRIWVISVNSTGDLLTLDRVIALPDSAIPFNATFVPSGDFAYVTGGLPEGDPPIGLPHMIFKVDPNTGGVSAPIGGDDSVTFSCCQFSPDSMFAFATFSALQIDPIAFAEGMIKINTLSHMIVGSHSSEPHFPNGSGRFVVTSDGSRAVYDQEIAFGRPGLLTLSTADMTVLDERTLDDDVVGMAIVHQLPGAFAEHVLHVGSVAYVADSSGIAIIKKTGLTFTPDGSIAVPAGVGDLTFALTPAFFRAYTLPNSGLTAVPIDLEFRTPGSPIPVASNNAAIRATPDGTCVFVTDGVGSIYIINTSTGMLDEPPISVGEAVFGIAVTDYSCSLAGLGPHPRAFAGAANALLEINLAVMPRTWTVINGCPDHCLSGVGTNVATTPDGKFTYVANNGNQGVFLVGTNPEDPIHDVLGTLQGTGFGSWGLAISSRGNFAYVAGGPGGVVSQYQTGSLTPEAQIVLGGNPAMMIALTTDGGLAYVAHVASSSVSLIRTSDMTVAAGPIDIGSSASAIAAR